jgi:hypothetical protein
MKRCFALLALGLLGCTSSQTVTTVEAVVAATEAAVTLLPNIPAPIRLEVTTYLGLVSDGVTCVNAELATSNTGVARALKIAACFSGLNLSQANNDIALYVDAVNTAIKALLAFYPTTGQNVATISASQHRALGAIQVRNLAVTRKVGGRLTSHGPTFPPDLYCSCTIRGLCGTSGCPWCGCDSGYKNSKNSQVGAMACCRKKAHKCS